MANTSAAKLKLPYPWFGGKTKAAPLIWQALGDCRNYVEPFLGGGAALLLRPDYDPLRHTETVNDLDSNLANFWRSLQADPEAVAHWSDYPVNEVDLHARHRWLTQQTWGANSDFSDRMRQDPDFYDAKQAGWWVWGVCISIGTFLDGPKHKNASIPNLGNGGRGIHRKMPSLSNGGQGVQRKSQRRNDLPEYLYALADRTRRVRVCCGDALRVLTPSITVRHGLTGVLLDPPYASYEKVYGNQTQPVSARVREWAIANGDNPQLRIILCGYEGEHDMPSGWRKLAWKANKGYATAKNSKRAQERLWLSPHCLPMEGEVPCGE